MKMPIALYRRYASLQWRAIVSRFSRPYLVAALAAQTRSTTPALAYAPTHRGPSRLQTARGKYRTHSIAQSLSIRSLSSAHTPDKEDVALIEGVHEAIEEAHDPRAAGDGGVRGRRPVDGRRLHVGKGMAAGKCGT